MKSKLIRIAVIVVPVFCVGVFLYMTFYNAAYDHPGKYVYKNQCASCHGDNGEGVQSLIPPLADADMAKANFDSLPYWIIKGMNHPIKVNGKAYEQTMYPIWMSDVEMTNLLNYLADDMMHVKRHYHTDSINAVMKRYGQTGI